MDYYTPDPNAPIRHKINPCHCDHVDALNWVQDFFEFFGTHCQCCSGVRVFTLLLAIILRMVETPVAVFLSNLLVLIVCGAIVYGAFTSWRDEFVRMNDVDSDED